MPDPGELLARLHGKDLMCGRISDFTDSGGQEAVFAVIEVEEFDQALLVPTASLLRADEG